MKNPHEMTRLELEKEVFDLRQKVQDLQAKINQQNYIIDVYGTYIDKQQHKSLIRRKDWYD